jgi:hypothetical protein
VNKRSGFESWFSPLLVLAAVSCLVLLKEPAPPDRYFGQDTPGAVLTPFRPDIFSTGGGNGFHLHSSLFFTLDGKEVFFTNQKVPVEPGYDQTILVAERRNGKMSVPRTLPFSGSYSDQIFHLSPDGARVYFTSTRPPDGRGDALDSRGGWIAERGPGGWAGPRPVASPFDLTEDDGPLYVSAQWPGGLGGDDVYRLAFAETRYAMPENQGPPINTELDEHACCWPNDERYLIFYRFHPDDRDVRGLYLSFRERAGTWTEPVPLSKMLGVSDGFRATLSPDERFLFILNRGDGVYWIDSRVVERQAKERTMK